MSETTLVDYRPDGTVRVRVGAKQVRLRRPTVGELWQIQEELNDVTDDWQDMEEAHAAKMVTLCDEHGVSTDGVDLDSAWWLTIAQTAEKPPKEFKRAARDANRKHHRKVMGLWFGLGRLVFKTLGPTNGEGLPDADEDLDPALGSQALYVHLLRHWQEVPLGSGRSSTPTT